MDRFIAVAVLVAGFVLLSAGLLWLGDILEEAWRDRHVRRTARRNRRDLERHLRAIANDGGPERLVVRLNLPKPTPRVRRVSGFIDARHAWPDLFDF